MTGTYDDPAVAELSAAVAGAFIYMAIHGIDRIEVTRDPRTDELRTTTGTIPVVRQPPAAAVSADDPEHNSSSLVDPQLTDDSLPSAQGLGGVFYIRQRSSRGLLAVALERLRSYMSALNLERVTISTRAVREDHDAAAPSAGPDVGGEYFVLDLLQDDSIPAADSDFGGVLYVWRE